MLNVRCTANTLHTLQERGERIKAVIENIRTRSKKLKKKALVPATKKVSEPKEKEKMVNMSKNRFVLVLAGERLTITRYSLLETTLLAPFFDEKAEQLLTLQLLMNVVRWQSQVETCTISLSKQKIVSGANIYNIFHNLKTTGWNLI